jgi:hypothetical protein
MTWQEWVDSRTRALGGTETSRYRTPAQERALGGPSSSYHTRGDQQNPGAIDIGGTAEQLSKLFDDIKQAFKGRIEELYLNIPGGRSVAIKDNRYLGSNPEAGRAQHLHVAIGAGSVTPGLPQPAEGIPAANSGDKALDAAPADVCVRSLCTPDLLGGKCICWSDVWVYSASVVLIGTGLLLVTRGKS